MKKIFTLTFLFALFTAVTIAQPNIFGRWKTIDDETGKERSVVEIYKKNGLAYGKIVKLFREPGEDPDPVCKECSDHRKDQRIIGMEIIQGMQPEKEEWDDGTILDPNNGKIYDAKLWIENGQLKVRGYIAFFYRTQTWLRVD